MLLRDVWQGMEKRIKQLPRPPRALSEQPKWAIPSDGLPKQHRPKNGSPYVTMKVVRVFPSGWDGYPIFISIDVDSSHVEATAIEVALFSQLIEKINEGSPNGAAS